MFSRSNESIGTFYALLSAFFWSLSYLICKFLLQGDVQQVDPRTLVFLRYLAGSLFLFLWSAVAKKRIHPGSRRRVLHLIRAGFFMYCLMNTFCAIGQQYVTATTASLFVECAPAFLMVLWRALRRQPVTKGDIIASVLGIFGCTLVMNIISPAGIGLSGNGIGLAFLFFASCSWTIGNYCARDVMYSGDAIVTTAWCQFFASIMMLPQMIVMHDTLTFPSTWQTWLAIGALGLFPTAIAYGTWGKAMTYIFGVKLNMMQNLTPVFTMFGAWLLLDEAIEWWNILGMLIVFTGITAAVIYNKKARHEE